MPYNLNPYANRTNHIPSTRFDFTRLSDYKILFIFNSLYQKMLSLGANNNVFTDLSKNLDNAELQDINNHSDKNKELLDSSYYTTSEERVILYYFNDYMYKILDNKNSVNIDPSMLESINQFLSNSGKNLDVLKESILSPNDDTYPYKLNIVDTGVPTDLYYKFVYINENTLIILVFDQFLEHLSSNIKNYYYFIKQLLMKQYEQLTIAEVARTAIFENYVKLLGTTYV